MDMDAVDVKYSYAKGPNDYVSPGSSIIAMRTGVFDGGYDYHFMAKHSGDSFWSFKSGKDGPVLRIGNGLNPSQVAWSSYENMGIPPIDEWRANPVHAYTGPIEYLIISP
jgi:hypothetical protein